jgi:hypothetical protein
MGTGRGRGDGQGRRGIKSTDIINFIYYIVINLNYNGHNNFQTPYSPTPQTHVN